MRASVTLLSAGAALLLLSARGRWTAGLAGLHRRNRRHHSSRRGRLRPAHDREGGRGRSGAGRHHAAHARRPRRLDPRHQQRHHPREDAGRRVRRPVGQSRRVGRLPHHHRGRHRRHGARHAHRRGASRLRQRREGRRDDVEEDDVRRRRICADARGAAEAQRRAGRAGGDREPLVHRTGGDRRDVRRSSISSPTTCPTCVRKLDGRTIARFDGRSQTLRTTGVARRSPSR